MRETHKQSPEAKGNLRTPQPEKPLTDFLQRANETLVEQNIELRVQVQQLEPLVENLQNENASYALQLAEANSKILALEKSVGPAKELQKTVDALRADNDELIRVNMQVNAERDGFENQLAQQQMTQQSKIDEAYAVIESLRKRIRKLEQEQDTLKDDYWEAQGNLKTAKDKLRAAEENTRFTVDLKTIAEKENRNQALRKQIEEQARAHQVEREHLEAEVDRAYAHKAQAKANLEVRNKELAEAQAKSTALEKQNLELTGRVHEEANAHVQTRLDMEKEVQRAEEAIEALQTDHAANMVSVQKELETARKQLYETRELFMQDGAEELEFKQDALIEVHRLREKLARQDKEIYALQTELDKYLEPAEKGGTSP